MNILEKCFDLGYKHYLANLYIKIKEVDFPLYLMNKDSKIRFKPPQIPDRVLVSFHFNYCFEMKHNKGNSMPLSNIKPHQIEFMKEFEAKAGKAYFILSFNEMDIIYLISISDITQLIASIHKKSINTDDLKGLSTILHKIKLKTNDMLDLSQFDYTQRKLI